MYINSINISINETNSILKEILNKLNLIISAANSQQKMISLNNNNNITEIKKNEDDNNKSNIKQKTESTNKTTSAKTPSQNPSSKQNPTLNSSQKKEAANNQEKNNKDNNVEVLPTAFDYQGNKEAELKYGQSTKSTTEYINPIIKSDVKAPNLILEYIEPILQVHYPDGTTKSTALPARLQTEDGKEPNIAPEQLKNIHEQIYKNFNKSALEYQKEKNRANSVSKKNPIVNELARPTVNVQNSLSNLNHLTPNFKSFQNSEINSNSSDINAVRSALKPNINMNIKK